MWPTDRYGLIHRETVLQHGTSERRLAAAVHSEELIVVARGAYILGQGLQDRDDGPTYLYRQRCIAAAIGPGRPVLSHDSAAAVLGIELLYADRSQVHVTNGLTSSGCRRPRRMIHAGLLPNDEVVDVNGIRVTSCARTVADVALWTGMFPQALAAFDSARRAKVGAEEMERLLARRRRGVGLARHALAMSDGRSDNPGESWSRAQMIEAGLPLPDLQVEYELPSGKTAFCDFGVEGQMVGEFDGKVKYRRDMRPGEEPEDAVFREKVREDELRELGLDVRRWIFDDLKFRRMVPKLQRCYDKLGIRY